MRGGGLLQVHTHSLTKPDTLLLCGCVMVKHGKGHLPLMVQTGKGSPDRSKLHKQLLVF